MKDSLSMGMKTASWDFVCASHACSVGPLCSLSRHRAPAYQAPLSFSLHSQADLRGIQPKLWVGQIRTASLMLLYFLETELSHSSVINEQEEHAHSFNASGAFVWNQHMHKITFWLKCKKKSMTTTVLHFRCVQNTRKYSWWCRDVSLYRRVLKTTSCSDLWAFHCIAFHHMLVSPRSFQ